jgi:hypothetical protein
MLTPDPPERAPETPGGQSAEALEVLLRAAIHLGREVLDTVERTLDDPAVAAALAELVANAAQVAKTVGGLAAIRRARGGAPPGSGVERIEVT